MRRSLAAIALTALAGVGIAPSATAQTYGGYGDPCISTRQSNEAAGAVLGAVIGGVLGSNLAGRRQHGGGAVLGAGLGAVTGAAAGGGAPCGAAGPTPYPVSNAPFPHDPPPPPADGRDYSDGDDGYRSPPLEADDPRWRSRRPRLAERDSDPYGSRQDDYAGRDCATATQVTRLPDGTSLERPVQVCREARYGAWEVQN